MKVQKKEDEITLRDIPATNWIYGLLNLIGSMIFSASFVGKVFHQRPDVWQVNSLIVVRAALYWAYKKFSSPIIIKRIKIPEQIIAVTGIRFLLLKKTRQFSFSQIRRAETVGRKSARAILYFTVLTLFDDAQIDLESSGNATNTVNRLSSLVNDALKSSKSSDSKPRRERRKRN